MIPIMYVSEIVSFLKVFIYVFTVLAALTIIRKYYKIQKDIYDLCMSQEQFMDTVERLIDYAQTSDDNDGIVDRSDPAGHVAAIGESCFELCRMFRDSTNKHISFNTVWKNSGLTVSKMYDKSFSKALDKFDEVVTGDYRCSEGIRYDVLIDAASGVQDDEYDEWVSSNISSLKNCINIEARGIMIAGIIKILHLPIVLS